MPNYDLMLTAIRVLRCCTENAEPAPHDVQELRQAVTGAERDLHVDELAVYIIDRETKRLTAKAAGAQ